MGQVKTEQQPLAELSVLVSSFNKKEFLPTSSVFLQDIANLGAQVIVIEDSSTDGSVDIIQSWSAVKNGLMQLVIQENSGSAQSRNRAITLADRTYLLFVDIDDEIDVEILKVLFPKVLDSMADIALSGYIQMPSTRLGPYPLLDFANKVTSTSGRRTELFHGMGWWRYIYKNETLKKNALHFTPTFSDMGGKIFVLDDLFWLMHLFSMDLSVYRCDESEILYKYFLPENTSPSRRSWYLDQVILIPDAMKVFLHDLDSHVCQHDKKWLLNSCRNSLWQHANYLDIKRFSVTAHKFVWVSIRIDLKLRDFTFKSTLKQFLGSFSKLFYKYLKSKFHSDPIFRS